MMLSFVVGAVTVKLCSLIQKGRPLFRPPSLVFLRLMTDVPVEISIVWYIDIVDSRDN